jgi:hypothetical protein
MIFPRYQFSASLLLIAAASVAGLAGCGRSRPVAHVGGKIVIKDESLRNAGVRMVRFEPTVDSNAAVRKGASGIVNDDGSFELYTRRPGDGVHLGKYAVTFAFYRGAMDQRSLIPAKYTSATTTPYQVVVDQDYDDLTFEIEPVGSATSKARN